MAVNRDSSRVKNGIGRVGPIGWAEYRIAMETMKEAVVLLESAIGSFHFCGLRLEASVFGLLKNKTVRKDIVVKKSKIP